MLTFRTNREPYVGRFLVSNVVIQEGLFFRKVILLVEHGPEGSIGLILNRRVRVRMHNDEKQQIVNKLLPIYQGGPLKQEDLLQCLHRGMDRRIHKGRSKSPPPLSCLHRGMDRRIHKGKRVLKGLYWGGISEDADGLMKLKHADKVRFFLGYSGWSGEQLHQEMQENTWYVLEEKESFIFETPPEKMWEVALGRLGDYYRVLKFYPEDISLH